MTDRAIQNLQGIGWLVPYLQNNLGFKKHVEEVLNNGKENKKIVDLLLEGSEREDAYLDKYKPETWRSMNHFHSPIENVGLHEGEQCFKLPLTKKWRCFQLEGESALGWAKGTGEGCDDAGKCGGNQYSWISARESYRDSFEALRQNDHATWELKMAETFRSLGQVMHLIQDMAVPAHTRNDSWVGHIPFGNNLENFLESNRALVSIHGANGQIPAFVNRPLA